MKTKQQVHYRKIGNTLVRAGKGMKSNLVGKSVWYNKKVYLVVRKNKNNTYDIKNLTARLSARNIPKVKLRLYK